jgi:hypothetical protein
MVLSKKEKKDLHGVMDDKDVGPLFLAYLVLTMSQGLISFEY